MNNTDILEALEASIAQRDTSYTADEIACLLPSVMIWRYGKEWKYSLEVSGSETTLCLKSGEELIWLSPILLSFFRMSKILIDLENQYNYWNGLFPIEAIQQILNQAKKLNPELPREVYRKGFGRITAWQELEENS